MKRQDQARGTNGGHQQGIQKPTVEEPNRNAKERIHRNDKSELTTASNQEQGNQYLSRQLFAEKEICFAQRHQHGSKLHPSHFDMQQIDL